MLDRRYTSRGRLAFLVKRMKTTVRCLLHVQLVQTGRAWLSTGRVYCNSAVTSAGAFGGLLAVCPSISHGLRIVLRKEMQAAISNMDGVGGNPAW